ncbi:MAG: nickel-dependent hydrogenase large subunit [Candidatus Methanomethylicia archaeon]
MVKNALKIRRLSQKILEILGGSSVHPSAAIAGGFLNCLKPSQQSELLSETLDSIAILNKIIEENEEKLYNINNDAKAVPSNFVSLYSSSTYPLYDSEKIHAISMSGELLSSFKFSEYFENINEETSPWSYSKIPYLKKRGLEKGVYRVGPLARFNINGKIDSEMAEELMNKFLSNVKKPIVSSSYYNIVRLIEIAYVLDKILEHLSSKNVQENAPPSKNLKIINNEGIGIIEAPRGLLIHRYRVDEDGYIKDADMIVATTQNTPIIAKEITDVSREIIHKDGVLKEKLYNVISKLIRNYDPCLSCATHSYNIPFILEMRMRDKVIYYPKTF